MPFADVHDVRLYYEFTGPEDAPLILQFGGSLFGRQNFDAVNDGFRENFRPAQLRRLRLRALNPAADPATRSRTGPTRARGCSTRWGSSGR